MRFYIVNCYGDVLGEHQTQEGAIDLMNNLYTNKQINDDEIEVIEG